MPEFRIFRMKDHVRARFRNAPHTSGETPAKLIDYVESGKVEAANAYEAWESLRGSAEALQVGDLLETELGALKICKYVGFEEAKWIVPEPAAEAAQPAAQPAAETGTL